MKLLSKRLSECSDFESARRILNQANAGPGIIKLVETSMVLRNSKDPQQRDHAASFMQAATEELDNYNNGYRENGSYGSSQNRAPYSNPAVTSQNGMRSMTGMEDAQNQWSPKTYQKVRQIAESIANERIGQYNKYISKDLDHMKGTMNKLHHEQAAPRKPASQRRDQRGKAFDQSAKT